MRAIAKPAKPKKGDNNWLGIMGVGQAKLYNRNRKLIATCNDTPNAIACAAYHCKPYLIVDGFGDAVKPDANRLANAGWMTLDRAGFKKAK